MKRMLWVFILLIVAGIGSVYILIPTHLPIAEIAVLDARQTTVYRALTEPLIFQKMSGKVNSEIEGHSATLQHNEIAFQFREQGSGFITSSITYKDLSLESMLTLINKGGDSAAVGWRTEVQTSKNPFKRIQQYHKGKKIKTAMSEILERLQGFVAKKDNVYGFNVIQSNVTDTFLITTKATTTNYPDKREYYILIKKLETYIHAQGAAATNYPMLNIIKLDSNLFEIMAAVPVNRELPNTRNIVFKKMVAGKVISSEVSGGRNTIEQAFDGLSNYASDYRLSRPALSYQSLITNRLTQADSSKWITRVYLPVF